MYTYGLIGYPLKHSFSQCFFSEKFSKENIDAQYLNFEIPQLFSFPDIVKQYQELKGLNVTIPYKQEVMQYLDFLDPQAEEIGAVNVVKIDRANGQIVLKGYNTDIIGFQQSIEPLIDKTIHHKALVLGTGGASKAVVNGLQNLGLDAVLVSRTRQNAPLSYHDIDAALLEQYTVIVNSTPLGTFPDVDNAPDIPYHLLSANHLLYDLVYNPAETKFLRLGKTNGASVKNGAEMLRLQALAAWDIWNK